jgi:hypothetical protein
VTRQTPDHPKAAGSVASVRLLRFSQAISAVISLLRESSLCHRFHVDDGALTHNQQDANRTAPLHAGAYVREQTSITFAAHAASKRQRRTTGF